MARSACSPYGLAIWALATMLVGVVSSFLLLLVLRLMLGVGESVGFPCTSKILAAAVPGESLGTANGIIAFAYLLGPAVGIFLGGVLIEGYGWRMAFVVFGLLSLLWLLPWSRVGVRQRAAKAMSRMSPALDDSQAARLVGCEPGPLLEQLHFLFHALLAAAVPGARARVLEPADDAACEQRLPGATRCSAIAGGWAIDRYIARSGSTNFGYKLVMGATHLGAIVCMLCMALGPRPVALASIFVYQALCGMQSPGVFAISQILAGPAAAGRWVGIQNTLGNLAGIIAPALTGFIVEWTGHFTLAFVLRRRCRRPRLRRLGDHDPPDRRVELAGSDGGPFLDRIHAAGIDSLLSARGDPQRRHQR